MYDEEMIKVQLHKLIKIHKERFPAYVVDELAKQYGHTVVRTLPYHCEFNAEELIWAQIKSCVAQKNTKYTLNHNYEADPIHLT